MDYISIYQKHFGITWNRKKMEIHHIDRNRDNNSIENLILLPKELHRRLHLVLSDIDALLAIDPDFINQDMKRILNGINSMTPNIMERYYNVLLSCQMWGLLKNVGYMTITGEKMTRITINTTIYGGV